MSQTKQNPIKVSAELMEKFHTLLNSGVTDTTELCTTLGVNAKTLNGMRLKLAHSLLPKLTAVTPAKSDASLSKGGKLVVSKAFLQSYASTSGIDLAATRVKLIPMPDKKILVVQFS